MSEPLDPRQAQFVGRRSDGSVIQRPLSPHLQAYDMMQVTSLTSILHRISGAIWSAGALLLVWWLAALAGGEAAFDTAQSVFGSFIGIIVLFGLTAAAWYHTLAGIRHLAWDAGWGFDLPTVFRTGQAVFAGTAALTVLTWIIALVAW
jgi:succinate dehydrogenase / fumarate reductase, cytochrome b subunit